MRNAIFAAALVAGTATAADDGLAEVNAARARRGLRPFVRDDALTAAAARLADYRAARHLSGHTANDFAALPAGAHASATGCGSGSPAWGWLTCCTFDDYAYAGAAVTYGTDGKRYMHLVVRGGSGGGHASATHAAAAPVVRRVTRRR